MQTLVASLVDLTDLTDLTDLPAKAAEHNAREWSLLFANYAKAIMLTSKYDRTRSSHRFHSCLPKCVDCSLNCRLTKSSTFRRVLREISEQ